MRVFCECGLSRNVRTFKRLTWTFKAWNGLSGNIWTGIYASALAAYVRVCGSSMVRFCEPQSALLSNTWTVMCINVQSAFLSSSKNEMCQLWSEVDFQVIMPEWEIAGSIKCKTETGSQIEAGKPVSYYPRQVECVSWFFNEYQKANLEVVASFLTRSIQSPH